MGFAAIALPTASHWPAVVVPKELCVDTGSALEVKACGYFVG